MLAGGQSENSFGSHKMIIQWEQIIFLFVAVKNHVSDKDRNKKLFEIELRQETQFWPFQKNDDLKR